ncbi:MAG TPA: gliding motility-associated C-terminal domain-containing protein, partial [Nitrosopumilaceae archaeon]|nr:gliding motility-associated C-terminal domain-containing protein [Nitrosopumilaceae archaeon]
TVTGTNTVTGCSDTSVVTVNVSSINATINASPNNGTAPLNVQFTNLSSGGNYTWNYGNGSTQNTISDTTNSVYQTVGTYTVTMLASNSAGCKDSATVIIVVDEVATILIPNVFSPNNDGVNDMFFIKSTGYTGMDITVYDRWGLKMWESTSVNGAWDGKVSGKEASDGTYYYILNATNNKGATQNYKGYLTLIK